MTFAVDEAADLAKRIDLTEVVSKAAENFGWDEGQTQYALDWYLRFLYLRLTEPSEPLAALSHAADNLWHQHIIDTRKYAADCNILFGKFLDHRPIYGTAKSEEIEIIESTKTVYSAAFGDLPRDMKVTSGDYSYAT